MKTVCSFLTLLILSSVSSDYWETRKLILDTEDGQLLGSSIQLSEAEKKVNSILMSFKLKEYDQGFKDPEKFPPSKHFFEAKPLIEQSQVFRFIQKMPKGASLHSHTPAMLSLESLIRLTYLDGLYGCNNKGVFQMAFFFGSVGSECWWLPLHQWRNAYPTFNNFLKSQLSLVVDDPLVTYRDINSVWSKFQKIFLLMRPLFRYKRFLHDYIYLMLQEFYDDNVRYLEMRLGPEPIFDSNNRVYTVDETLELYSRTLLEFRERHPDFLGFRIIYARGRKTTKEKLSDYIDAYFRIKHNFPHLIAGFDLVGQEDLGLPLSDLLDQLLPISNQTDFFFHAGETNWYGTLSDTNLLDAVLLNSKRIGHAYAINKHPQVSGLIKARNIGIELNPLSNQILKLVQDLRNHVGAELIANNFPVVITCDDPGFWGAKGVSYDWYMAFMAMAPRNGDLRILKQLARNSFIHSSLNQDEKIYAMLQLEIWWNEFIKNFLDCY